MTARTPWLIGALCVALTGCDLLLVEPPPALSVTVAPLAPLVSSQAGVPLTLDVFVDGCADFDLRVQAAGGPHGQRLDPIATGFQRYRVDLAPRFLADVLGTCEPTDGDRASLELEAHCLEDGRRAVSAVFEVEWSVAWGRTPPPAGVARRVFAAGGDRFVALVDDTLVRYAVDRDPVSAPAAVDPEAPAQAAHAGDWLWLSAGCPEAGCAPLEWSDAGDTRRAAGTPILAYDTGDGLRSRDAARAVPGALVGMLADADGGLFAVSGGADGTHLSVFAPDGARRIITHDRRPWPTAPAQRDDGARVVLTLDADDPGRAWRFEGDGPGAPIELPIDAPDGRLALAPNGRRWALLADGRAWVGGEAWPWRELETHFTAVRGHAWLGEALILYDGVEFEVHADGDRWFAGANPDEGAGLAHAVDTTPDGVAAFVFARSVWFAAAGGVSLGAIDPIGCEGTVRDVALGVDRALVSVGDRLLWFDLSRYREEGLLSP